MFPFQVFQTSWLTQAQILTDAVDDIVTVEDFLFVSESHILEDVNRCCLALQEQDSAGLQTVSASIRGRGMRISEVVTQEMDGFEAGDYSDRVREAVKLLQTELIPNFERHVVTAVGGVEEGYKGVDENEFIEACRLVYDGVREVRRAVLVNREAGEDTDTEEEEQEEVTRSLEVAEVSLVDEYPDISGEKLVM